MDATPRLIEHLRPEAPTALLPVALTGGKGRALESMIRAGLPVPETWVITTDAYRAVAAGGTVRALVEPLVRSVPGSDVDDPAIDEVFAVAELPPEVRRAVAELAVVLDGPVAVRSSATTEDLADASFAGQYRSVLGVQPDDLLPAVRQVWASLWHASPRAYRAARGISAEPAMAVVVQRMVPAIRAGVCFTVDPADGSDRIRVESVDGLGEALVSGRATPEVAHFERSRADDAGGVFGPLLPLALDAEKLFGAPQDVEWADDGDRVWIVQSRPTTTGGAARGDGGDTPVTAHRRYTTAGIAEMVPGVLPRLRWDEVSFALEEAFRSTLGRLGAVGRDGQPLLVRLHGRAALDLDTLSSMAEQLPGTAAEDLEREYLGESVASRPVTSSAQAGWRRWLHDLRVFDAHRRALREQSVVVAAIHHLAERAGDWLDLDDVALLALRHRLLDLAARAMAAELSVAAAAVASYARLEARLAKYVGDQASWWARGVTSGIDPATVVTRAARLAGRLRNEAPEVFSEATWQGAVAALDRGGHDDLSSEMVDVLRQAGSRRSFGGSTWAEEPDRLWELIVASDAHRRGGVSDVLDEAALDRHLAQLPGWRRFRILTGQVVDVRRLVTRRLVDDTRDMLEARENGKAAVLVVGGVVRAVDVELGRRLAERGSLLMAEDVVHLSAPELVSLVFGGSAPTVGEVTVRRHAVERLRAEEELPMHFAGLPRAIAVVMPEGDRVRGWAASAGRCTGRVHVMRRPRPATVHPGDVVVARRTDASWTPVLLRAGAIVVEEGGPLSHAAIVAREFGVPAVVNVPGVVAWLSGDDVIATVDGDEGTIVRHAPSDPARWGDSGREEVNAWSGSPR